MNDRGRVLAGKLTDQDNAYQGEKSWHEKPHDELVEEIKGALDAARLVWEKRNGPGTFDPVIWIGERLTVKAHSVIGESGNSLPTRIDTSLAWDAIARPHIRNAKYQADLAAVLISGTALRRSSLVTLDPEAVKLIDAMADAVGIPHTRGQRTVDLLTPAQKADFREIYTRIAKENGI